MRPIALLLDENAFGGIARHRQIAATGLVCLRAMKGRIGHSRARAHFQECGLLEAAASCFVVGLGRRGPIPNDTEKTTTWFAAMPTLRASLGMCCSTLLGAPSDGTATTRLTPKRGLGSGYVQGIHRRTWRFTEWQPRNAVGQLGPHWKPAIGELIVRRACPRGPIRVGWLANDR